MICWRSQLFFRQLNSEPGTASKLQKQNSNFKHQKFAKKRRRIFPFDIYHLTNFSCQKNDCNLGSINFHIHRISVSDSILTIHNIKNKLWKSTEKSREKKAGIWCLWISNFSTAQNCGRFDFLILTWSWSPWFQKIKKTWPPLFFKSRNPDLQTLISWSRPNYLRICFKNFLAKCAYYLRICFKNFLAKYAYYSRIWFKNFLAKYA